MMKNKEAALKKMLHEMEKEKSPSVHGIHNWLCDQEDEELFEGVLQPDKTIKGAMDYCYSEAKKQSKGANSIMVDGNKVFNWVVDYFKNKVSKKSKENSKDIKKDTEIDVKPEKQVEINNKTENELRKEKEQSTLFDFI